VAACGGRLGAFGCLRDTLLQTIHFVDWDPVLNQAGWGHPQKQWSSIRIPIEVVALHIMLRCPAFRSSESMHGMRHLILILRISLEMENRRAYALRYAGVGA
jgi:hypothetical protein